MQEFIFVVPKNGWDDRLINIESCIREHIEARKMVADENTIIAFAWSPNKIEGLCGVYFFDEDEEADKQGILKDIIERQFEHYTWPELAETNRLNDERQTMPC